MSGPRPGSRPFLLSNMKPGDSALLEAPLGRLQPFMNQIAVDIGRCGLNGKITQSTILGVELSTRQVYEIVRVTRLPD